jgi:GntR family transcriptional regulator, rspAB operon transcriptional repressor
VKAASPRRADASSRRKAKSAAATTPRSQPPASSDRLGPTRDLPHDAVIADRLIKDIVTGVYAPGQWIREQEIAERFGVSRTPVRNAFRQVARAGFIVVRPWRGAQVLELSADDTRYVLDLLEALYGVAMRIAAETLPEQYFPEVDALLELSERAAQRNDLSARIALSFELGRKIARWSASALTYELLVRVGNLAFWQHRFFDFDVRALVAQSIVMHRELVAAIKGRKADVADRTAREIIALTRSFLIPRIRLAEMETARAARRSRKKRGS